jgi:hypothetical protein
MMHGDLVVLVVLVLILIVLFTIGFLAAAGHKRDGRR